MKKIFLHITLIAAIAISFTSCRGFEEQDVTTLNNVSDVITQGQWKINLYVNNNQDQTNVFTDYVFEFKQNGTLVATKNNVAQTGGWIEDRITKNIIITFNNNDPSLSKISDTWSINSQQIKAVKMIQSSTQNAVLGIAQQ